MISELIILKMGTTKAGMRIRDALPKEATAQKVTNTSPSPGGNTKKHGKRMQVRIPGRKKELHNFLFSHIEFIMGIM